MKLDILIPTLTKRYPGLVKVSAWGETSLFYNPHALLKRGTYCITFKEKDGKNDSSSVLDRKEVEYRMNFKISKPTFLAQFNEPSLPSRPAKGNIITLKSGRLYDPTALDILLPHPVYGWMGWVSIINPSEKSIEDILKLGLLDESYQHAKAGYEKNTAVKVSRKVKRKDNPNENEQVEAPVSTKKFKS
eukprot:c15154_g1_i1.p1 GENE.c15154_g1_i1~~c15154_g1_i1.p1  ORF type:complete len:189 (+),score=-13.83 c15154_g1_i1:45-611(+)